MEKEENILGYEKIGKLIRKFSIPSIISMLVNSLYNIIDQVFIGQGVGYLGNGATNIVFPLVVIATAISSMFGSGAASYLSLKLGEKKEKEASKGVGNAVCATAIISIILCAISVIFLPQLLQLFGCTESLKDYALQYGYIIAIGFPFTMIATSLSNVIRADGSPKYSMISMVSGAILNTILDPIFIFVFKLGMSGAAIATVLSQIVTFILNIIYLKRFKTIKIKKEDFKLSIKVIRKISILGISSLVSFASAVIVMSIQNNLLAKYGKASRFGAEIPITVLGIVMKITQILSSIILGIAMGAQPIFGYNYGAEKYDRVKEATTLVLKINFIIATISFIIFQTMPDKLISIFGSGDALYTEFACLAFRIYLLLFIPMIVQLVAGIFFQSIGKSIKSTFISLSRQILILIPAMFILGNLFGVEGILYAGPVADGVAFILSTIFLVIELKNMNHIRYQTNSLIDDTSTDNQLSKHIVITISREYGSGGRYIGRLIADKLGIKFYDKDLVTIVSEKTGLTEEYIENNEQKRNTLATLGGNELTNTDELFISESQEIIELANKESCVIVGRCADFVLKDRDDVIKIFVYSNMKDKVKRVTEFYGVDKDKAEKEINKINKLRANHYKYYTERDWKDYSNYDICINSDLLGVERVADMICEMINESSINVTTERLYKNTKK